MTTTVLNTKMSEVKNKINDHSKFITTQEFNNLTANLVSKTDFDNKLISFNRKIT